MERYGVQSRDHAQATHVVRHHGVVGAEHRPESVSPGHGLADARAVEVVTEQIDAVRTRQVIEAVAVEVGNLHALRALDENAGAEALAHDRTERDRDPVAAGEFEVGEVLEDDTAGRSGAREALLEDRGEAQEALVPTLGDDRRCAVHGRERRLVESVSGQSRGQPLRNSDVALQRWVLGARPREAVPQAAAADVTEGGECAEGEGQFHAVGLRLGLAASRRRFEAAFSAACVTRA